MRQLISMSLCGLVLFVSASSALGDATTNALNGINHPGGTFTGAGIGIGQVEEDRPGLAGTDAAGNIHSLVVPAGVFRQAGTFTHRIRSNRSLQGVLKPFYFRRRVSKSRLEMLANCRARPDTGRAMQ